MRASTQKGVAHLGALFVIVFIGLVGYAGYQVMSMNKAAEGSPSSVTVGPILPETIATTRDLDTTNRVLDGTDNKLSNSLDDSDLDADLDQLL